MQMFLASSEAKGLELRVFMTLISVIGGSQKRIQNLPKISD